MMYTKKHRTLALLLVLSMLTVTSCSENTADDTTDTAQNVPEVTDSVSGS